MLAYWKSVFARTWAETIEPARKGWKEWLGGLIATLVAAGLLFWVRRNEDAVSNLVWTGAFAVAVVIIVILRFPQRLLRMPHTMHTEAGNRIDELAREVNRLSERHAQELEEIEARHAREIAEFRKGLADSAVAVEKARTADPKVNMQRKEIQRRIEGFEGLTKRLGNQEKQAVPDTISHDHKTFVYVRDTFGNYTQYNANPEFPVENTYSAGLHYTAKDLQKYQRLCSHRIGILKDILDSHG